MKRASTFLRIVLWLEGIVLILRTPQVIAGLKGFAAWLDPTLGSLWANLAVNLESGLPILGMCCLVSMWGMMSGKRWAERSTLILSGIHLVLFPFFTPIGIWGLLARKRKTTEEQLLGSGTRWQEPVPTAMLPTAFRLLSGVAIAGLGLSLFFLIRLSQTEANLLLPIVSLPGCIGVIYAFLAVVHDLGHFAAGWVSGFAFDAVPLGVFQRTRTDRGWKLTREEYTNWKHLLVGPRTLELEHLESRLFVHQLGGPITELVIGLICFISLVALRVEWLTEAVGIVGLLAFGRFLTEMALLRTSDDEFTDGARLLQLWNRDAEGERWCALHAIGRSQGNIVRPKDWPEAWVMRVSADPESPVYPAGCYYAYAHYLDRGDFDKAGEFIDRLQSVKGWKNQERISVEVLFHQALMDRRSAEVVDYGRAGYERSVSGIRMEAMALFADGFYNESERKIGDARKLLQSRKDNGWTLFESDLLDLVERRLNDARNRRNQNMELEEAPAGQFAELLRRTAM